MKILDLFCKAGGAAAGLKLAFPHAEIAGVDIQPQPRYPFNFIQGDALTFSLVGFDFIWASPPCQAHTALKSSAWDRDEYQARHKDLIPAVRDRLERSGRPYIIENVPGAPLKNPVILCGSHFGLRSSSGYHLKRHRLFESNFLLPSPPKCQHKTPTIGIFGSKARDTAEEKRHYSKPKESRGAPPPTIGRTLTDAKEAMGIDWMTFPEMSEAIPPAYSKWLGDAFSKNKAEEL